MIARVLGAIGGGVAGFTITGLCVALGLQSSNWKTLTVINVLAGVGGSMAGVAIFRYIESDHLLSRAKIDRTIGKLSGRYELESFGEEKLAVLKDFQEEINGP